MSGAPRPFPSGGLDSCDWDGLRVEEARQRMLQTLTPPGPPVMVPLRAALGRVLAEDVRARHDVPSSTNSAMDGYAVRSADVPGEGASLRVVGQAFAGHPYGASLAAGTCVQIMTGAPLPPGADAVVPQEQAQHRGEVVHLGPGLRAGQNVRLAGEDLARDQVALTAGTRLRPAELGLLASLGCAEVRTHRPLRVAFFSTGDELRSVGQALGPGEIYDSNRYTLYGMLQRLGVEVLDLGVVRDQPDALRAAFTEAAAAADAVVTSGGVSVGEADFVRRILADLGEVGFWKIAMKPGRPFAFGRVGQAAFFGLPGNPVAVMVTFLAFVRPALLRLMGAAAAPPPLLKARSQEAMRKKPGRTEYQRGLVTTAPDGSLQVRTTGNQGSGVLSSMVQANGLIVLHHGQGSVAPGDEVDVMMFEGVL